MRSDGMLLKYIYMNIYLFEFIAKCGYACPRTKHKPQK